MIAKLIIHGKDRDTAIARTIKALNRFHIKGIKTTIPFDKAVLHNKTFQKGDYNTSFIEKQLDSLVYREKDEDLFAALFSANQFKKQNQALAEKKEETDPWAMRNRINNM